MLKRQWKCDHFTFRDRVKLKGKCLNVMSWTIVIESNSDMDNYKHKKMNFSRKYLFL